MFLLNIIDKIYENSYFQTFLIGAIVLLIFLFIIVLIIGIKDARKAREPKVIIEEDIKDVTFDMPPEMENIKEDVTFEMPVLTKNLEDFKKNLEEEIQKEDEVEIRKTSGLRKNKESKPIKILDAHEIEDTAIVHLNELEEGAKEQEEDSKKEENTQREKTENVKEIKVVKNLSRTIEPKTKPEDSKTFTKEEKNAEIEVLMEFVEPEIKTSVDKSFENEDESDKESINVIKKDTISYIYDTEDDF